MERRVFGERSGFERMNFRWGSKNTKAKEVAKDLALISSLPQIFSSCHCFWVFVDSLFLAHARRAYKS